MSTSTLPADERQDVESMLRDQGRRLEEFDIRAQENILSTPSPFVRTIIVQEHASGVERVYQAGSGTDWITDFTNDLTKWFSRHQ